MIPDRPHEGQTHREEDDRRRDETSIRMSEYADYINSPEWRAVRDRYWQSRLPQECFVCHAPRRTGMHLHHRTYKRLGRERLNDIVPVCPPCHDLIHGVRHRAGVRNYWWPTNEVARAVRGAQAPKPWLRSRPAFDAAVDRIASHDSSTCRRCHCFGSKRSGAIEKMRARR